MTIHELEKRTGLDRATIRFYEKERLIAPKRLANGYRDYSEEDALALEKIALLRRLDFSLEQVRQVQIGALPLGLALENQREVLLEQRIEKEKALYLCDVIHQDGVSYQSLQPEKYLDRLPPPKPPVLPNEPKHYATKHPIRRWLARELDTALFFLPGGFLLAWLGAADTVWVMLLTWLAYSVFALLLEPLLLCTLGTTPGKWLMGLRLRYHRYYEGVDKPTFRQALFRTLHVWFQGCGMGIGLFTLIGYVCGYLRANRGDEQPWDYDWEYTADEDISGTAVCLLLAGLLAANFGQEKAMDLMEHRLEVIAEARRADPDQTDYINSVNLIFAHHWELADYRHIALDQDGNWVSDQLDLSDYALIFEQQGETLVSVSMSGPEGDLSSALANGLWLGLLEARKEGQGISDWIKDLSDGSFIGKGDWRMEYTVKDGIAIVTIEKTDEEVWSHDSIE